jgi:glycosyltransferase involved in cell wall biosynthesis
MIRVYHSRLDERLTVTREQEHASVLNVATVAFRKGQHVLAEAFARIAPDFPEWKLDLVGFLAEAACVERIRRIIDDGGLAERILLHGPHPAPTNFYQNASIYVQPSLLEGLGLSLQEAMFHGKACIGSDQGGIPELIANPGVGTLYPSGNVGALAEALAAYLSDAPLRTRIGTAARESILERGMTRQAMTTTYQKLYRETLR